MWEHKAIMVQGPPVVMAQELGRLEDDEFWEIRGILDRPLFGNRLTVWARRWIPDEPDPPHQESEDSDDSSVPGDDVI